MINLNRLGFLLLGITSAFAYNIMLAAAFDLLKQLVTEQTETPSEKINLDLGASNSSTEYCNERSTSTILFADSMPSLLIKTLYPFLLVGVSNALKVIVIAASASASFLITGLSSTATLVFAGVAFASLSSGLGDSTYLSNTPLYGDAALSGWSMGTGVACLFGSILYATLRVILSIRAIMLLMLLSPLVMLIAYFGLIQPVGPEANDTDCESSRRESKIDDQTETDSIERTLIQDDEQFDVKTKLKYLPGLLKYFMPLLVIHIAEYFINQGLVELIYYPNVTQLDQAAQYRWFQVAYQFGVMVSRSTLDLMQIRNLWAMSLLQVAIAAMFLAHTSKLIYIPYFGLVVVIIICEGLLAGFSYTSTFYRMKEELPRSRHEFAMSSVTIADTLGIVVASLVAIPVHNVLCRLYK